jgi:hypothetical protein
MLFPIFFLEHKSQETQYPLGGYAAPSGARVTPAAYSCTWQVMNLSAEVKPESKQRENKQIAIRGARGGARGDEGADIECFVYLCGNAN